MKNPTLMASHHCKAVVVTCIDFRFQPYINEWLKKNFQPGEFDRISLAGGIKNLVAIIEQIGISHRLHHIEQGILINHENCGAYGEAGTPAKHAEDLRNARATIQQQFPNVKVDTYYLHLDGIFKSIT